MQILPEILEVVAYVISAASVITAITPTPKDDAILAKVISFVRLLGLNVLNAKPK